MSLKIGLINGPNLNLLGSREKDIYGSQSLADLQAILSKDFPEVDFTFFQSNVEGELIDCIQKLGETCGGIVINPGGYSHTSVAIADAIASIKCPVVEVHISNIHSREAYRHHSITGSKCVGVITGLGFDGYSVAVKFLSKN
ncbi:MAG: type II 3-dehydroquinate dehydratase [Flavobacteriales bacterium]|nr:type II 3-dehydroquinate dehydratase [Flavobacteriales bacterium]